MPVSIHSIEEVLYPAIEPHWQGSIAVGEGHALWVEDCGPRDGVPIVFLHGGPGSGCSPQHRRLFDPQRHRTILFDQRGAGRSRPLGGVDANTTTALIADIERLRQHFGVSRWLVVGGSWGCLLGLAYAQQHPDRVTGLVLRGIFLGSDAEVTAFLGDAGDDANAARRRLQTLAGEGDVLSTFTNAILGTSPADEFVLAWLNYERALMGEGPLTEAVSDTRRAAVRIQMHYLRHRFFAGERHLIDGLDRVRHLPAVLVQGAEDRVCPPVTAARLHAAWPGSYLAWIDGAGHNGLAAPIAQAVIQAVNRLTASDG